MRSFGSDNHSGIHPRILKAIEEANVDHARGYGDDEYTKNLERLLSDMFGCSSSFVVFNGTGANVFALKNITESFSSIIAASTAHINVDECGAPEHHTGCKIVTIETPDGKLTPELVTPKLIGFGSEHHSQPKVISISQPTELGTLYTLPEIKSLSDLAHSYNMLLHIDGARLANAIVALNCTPRELTFETGADVVSLGGTKNGMMVGEVVMFFGDKLGRRGLFERKHAMQLYSKQRFISAQLLEYLKDGLWLEMAAHSNKMAQLLKSSVENHPAVKVTHKVETNAVFAIIPEHMIDLLSQHYFFYIWDESKNEVRWMTSFDTTEDDIMAFAEIARV